MPGAVLLPALHNDGTGGFSKSRLHEAHSDYREIRAADFTGDGLPEIVATSFDSRAVVFLENLGSRFVSGDVDTSVQSALSLSVGDFDGDFDLDIIAASLQRGDIFLYDM